MVQERLSIWLKLFYSAFLCLLIPVYWWHYGPQNFLWGCDIALFLALVALWREWSLPASMAILITLVPDVIWNLDYFGRLIAGIDLLGIDATIYMFTDTIPFFVRALSLFHLFLVLLLVWIIYRIGYDRRALVLQIGLSWSVLILSYLFTDPERNINYVFTTAPSLPEWLSGWTLVGFMMIIVPVIFHLPAHFLMMHLFGKTEK